MYRALPYVVLNFAISTDGNLDDNTDERLLISSKKDFNRVEEEREKADVIVVGGGTLLSDNPSLLCANNEDLIKAVVISAVNFEKNFEFIKASNFCNSGNGKKVIFITGVCNDYKILGVDLIFLGNCSGVKEIFELIIFELVGIGAHRLLFEGGKFVINHILENGLADEVFIYVKNGLRVGNGVNIFSKVEEVRGLKDIKNEFSRYNYDINELKGYEDTYRLVVKNKFSYKREDELIRMIDFFHLSRAVKLADKCVPSESSYSVGATIVCSNGVLVSEGFSHDDGSRKHAEELAIERIFYKCHHKDSCIYSSIEPCGRRLSGVESCSEKIIKSGIYRVVFAFYEPSYFLDGEGITVLKRSGLEVIYFSSDFLKDIIRKQNKHISKF